MYYREHTYTLDASHNPQDKMAAITKSMDNEKIPLGILYKEERKTYEQSLPSLENQTLVEKQFNPNMLPDLLSEFK